MKILTWNMGYPFHRDKHQEAWDYMINDLEELGSGGELWRA